MDKDKEEYKVPAGTITILVIFVLLIIALWGSAYLMLLSRGATG